jgi:uncharacterized protein (TIGR02996 family)
MADDLMFLRALLDSPGQADIRTQYSNWLKEQDDWRAPFVRLNPAVERISYIDWLEARGNLESYSESFPEVRREADEWKARKALRDVRRRLAATLQLHPAWVAFLDTLACSFQPFFFFSNHGEPREFRPEELPFAEQIGTRGAVVAFESDFNDGAGWEPFCAGWSCPIATTGPQVARCTRSFASSRASAIR